MSAPPPPHSISPTLVEYRQTISTGEIIIRVILSLPTPRFMAWMKTDDGLTLPISLFLDEILSYVEDAKSRLARGSSK